MRYRFLCLVISFLLLTATCFADILQDTGGTCTDTERNISTQTFSCTLASNSNMLLIVGVGGESGGDEIPTSVTWNGTESLTKINSKAFQYSTAAVSFWYLLNPTSGTHNIDIVDGSSMDSHAGTFSLYNVKQQAAEADSTGGSSCSVTTLTDKAWVVSVGGAANDANDLSAQDSQSEDFELRDTIRFIGGLIEKASAGNQDMGWGNNCQGAVCAAWEEAAAAVTRRVFLIQ